jgi:hypothetical protein
MLEMEEIEMPGVDPGNWKYAVGFVMGIIVTLIIIIVLANKYGKSCDSAAPPSVATSTPPLSSAPSQPQLDLPSIDAPDAPDGAGEETYTSAPF